MSTHRDFLGSIILITLLATFFLWQASHLGGFGRDYDEGVHLMEAWLVQEGYGLYSEVFCASLPVFILSIVSAFKLFGTSVEAGRALIVVYATLGLLGVAMAAQELRGKAASLAAMLLLAITPDFFYWSRGALGDLPSISLATLSLAFALRYWRLGSRHCLVLTGMALGTSLMTKLTSIPILVPVISLVFLAQDTHLWPKRIRPVIFLLIFTGLPILVCTLGYGRAMIDQAVAQHLRARGAYGLDSYQNGARIAGYLADNASLVTLATGGSIVLLTQVHLRKRVAILVLWFLMMGFSLLTHSPLFKHQLVILLPPLAILGGALISDMVERCCRLKEQTGLGKAFLLVIGLCSLIIYGLHFSQIIEMDRQLIHGPRPGGPEQRVIHFLETSVTEDDFVMTDEPYLAFAAGRLVPPSLADTSWKRFHTGYLSVPELVETTIKYEAQAVLLRSDDHSERRIVSAAPEYVNWLRENYRLAAWHDHRREIYVPIDFTHPNVLIQEPHIQHSLNVNFADKLIFLGYNVEEVVQKKQERSWLKKYLNAHADLLPHRATFYITYFWRCLEETAKDYTLVTQFEGHHGKTYRIDQSHQGVNGAYPTSMWQAGEVIREEYQMEVPADYPPIRYALWVGVRDGEERLEVMSDVETDEEERVKLGEIEVLPAKEPSSLAGKPHPQNRVTVNINDELVFLGYDLSERSPHPGDQLQVTTYWQSIKETERDYAIQVELRNEGYKVRNMLDLAPTRLWEEGRYYRGEAVIAINPHLLEGTYSVNLELEKDDGTETRVSLASLDIACRRRHILKRMGKANYEGSEILSPDEPLSLRFDLEEREALELVVGWTGRAGGEETRVEVYITNAYWRERYLGTWVVKSGDYRVTKRKIGKVFTAPRENVIELRVPEIRGRVHNIGWRGVVDRVFPDLLQDPRTDYDGPIQMDFAQVSSRWEGDWDDYYDLAKVYTERGMTAEVARLYEEAMEKGVEPGWVEDFALFKGAYTALGEEGKVGEIEERIAGRIAHKMNVHLGKVEFLGYSLSRLDNGRTQMSLFFRCKEEMEEDYTLWMHGEVEDESLLEGVKSERGYAVFDHLLPTSRWEVGEVYQDDEVTGFKPGRYHFTLGLWRPEDGSRLWREDDPNAHIIDLGWMEVK